MKALKYTFVAMFIWWSAQLCGGEISDIEFTRTGYPRYEVSDIFGVAKLLTSILTNSEQLKVLFQHPMDILRATFLVGSIAAMVRVSLLAVQGLSARLPDWTTKICRRCVSWSMRMLNLPEGFDYDQLVMCEQMFEQIISVWCDHDVVVSQGQSARTIEHWDYQRLFVRDVLHYLIRFLESHQCYYRAMQLKRGSSTMTTHIGDNRVDQVCFLVQSCVSSLRHLAKVSEQTAQPEDFDGEHVKKVARATVILLKKLCAIIGGESTQGHNKTEYNFVGQSFMPTSGLFDV